MAYLEVAGIIGLVILVLVTLLWLLSLRLRDASIVDIFWGTGFVIAGPASVASTARGLSDWGLAAGPVGAGPGDDAGGSPGAGLDMGGAGGAGSGEGPGFGEGAGMGGGTGSMPITTSEKTEGSSTLVARTVTDPTGGGASGAA